VDNLTNTPKTIIYLDQLVISNIAKVLDPEFSRREQLLKNDPFWLELYKKINRLLRMQLIVCPDSYYHRTESMLSSEISFDSLQDVYSYLSNDCTFHDQVMILHWQLQHYFRDYIEGHPECEPVIPASQIVSGQLHAWQNRRRVIFPYRSDPNEAASIRAQREERQRTIERAFALWQQKREPYSLTVQDEARNLGQALTDGFFSYFKKWAAYSLGLEQPKSPLDLIPGPSSFLFFALFQILEEYSISDPMEQLRKIHEYFQSQHILRVPFISLSSKLYAAIARRAPDMKSPPNIGTTTDVTAIAALLPYCQAMFVDNEMAGYLREKALAVEVARFGTRIFSSKLRTQFLAYLDEIEVGAEEQHIRCIKIVYGEKWLEPFMDVVTQGKRRRETEKK